MSFIDTIRRFLSGDDEKALMDINANINSTSSKTQTSGTGQTGKIKNKSGSITVDNSTNTYNIINLPPGQPIDEDVKSLLREQFAKGELQFVYQPSDIELVGYNEFEKQSNQIDLIKYFADKISSEDLQYLRTGLYIRQLSTTDKKRAVAIKERAAIGNKRARNIINMASAGYFENYIKPIFENSPKDEANKEYENIVKYLPEFIFVNNAMSIQDIVDEVQSRLEQKEKYHLHVQQIIISGLESCADTISKAEPELTKRYPEYDLSMEKRKSGQLQQAKLTIILNQPLLEESE